MPGSRQSMAGLLPERYRKEGYPHPALRRVPTPSPSAGGVPTSSGRINTGTISNGTPAKDLFSGSRIKEGGYPLLCPEGYLPPPTLPEEGPPSYPLLSQWDGGLPPSLHVHEYRFAWSYDERRAGYACVRRGGSPPSCARRGTPHHPNIRERGGALPPWSLKRRGDYPPSADLFAGFEYKFFIKP
jgi:hypothetical protein